MTITISPTELEATRAKFAVINKRATRRGFTGRLELDVQGPRTVSTETASGLPVETVVYDVAVHGEPPCYSGWRLLGVLDFDPHAGLITRCAPGVESIDRTDLRAGWCDHCKTNRARRKTYLVGSESGDQRQVGSSCLKDFLGHHANVVFFTEESVTDELFGNLLAGNRDVAYSTSTVLGTAWACIQKFGWFPASSHGVTTRDQVSAVLEPRSGADRDLSAEVAPLIADMAGKATQVRDFIVSDEFSGVSEYVTNLKAAVSAEYVSISNFGLVVSAPQAWTRHNEQTLIRKAQADAAAQSEHVGEVGAKIERDVTVTSVRYVASNWGTTSLYTLADTDGNVFKWFSSGSVLDDREGDTVTITGTVKKHDEYRGVKQTVLTRCKVQTRQQAIHPQLVQVR